MNEDKLLKLKKQIIESKELLQEWKGQEKVYMQKLEDEFGCSSIEQAENEVLSLNDLLDELDQKIKEKEDQLEQYEI